MSIIIKPIQDHEIYEINGKEVFKDTNGNWIQNRILSDAENRAFRTYKKQVIDNPRFKRHTKATYKE
jgi:hypothetical protein